MDVLLNLIQKNWKKTKRVQLVVSKKLQNVDGNPICIYAFQM